MWSGQPEGTTQGHARIVTTPNRCLDKILPPGALLLQAELGGWQIAIHIRSEEAIGIDPGTSPEPEVDGNEKRSKQ